MRGAMVSTTMMGTIKRACKVFRTLALDVKGVFLPFGEDAVFERRSSERSHA